VGFVVHGLRHWQGFVLVDLWVFSAGSAASA
jgi:hypothetical protein